MGLFTFLKKKEKKNEEKPQKSIIVEPFPMDDVEIKLLSDLSISQYERLYDKFDDLYDKYEDKCYEVEEAFYTNFSYSVRIRLLKEAIKQFDKIFNLVGPYWFEDDYFMDTLGLRNPNQWKVSEPQISDDECYVDEYEGYDFLNINFLKYLLNQYLDNPSIKKQLDEEVMKSKYREYGGKENYEKVMVLKKDILVVINEFGEIFQKDIKKQLANLEMVELVPKMVKELETEKVVEVFKEGRYIKVRKIHKSSTKR